jgi:hypothetical protein
MSTKTGVTDNMAVTAYRALLPQSLRPPGGRLALNRLAAVLPPDRRIDGLYPISENTSVFGAITRLRDGQLG